MGQLCGLVVAFLFMLSVATPLILAAEPANALSWALHYEVGRTFSLLDFYGEGLRLNWLWFAVFMLSMVICFLDIRRQRFFASSFVLLLLLFITLRVIYVDFVVEFKFGERVTVISPWLKIGLLVVSGNFMYLALRSRCFQFFRYLRSRAALRAERRSLAEGDARPIPRLPN
jgi:hypothetical protein